MKKIKLGVSACLLGKNVRYDGGHKLDDFIASTLAQYVEFVPVCPEYECGLGVPREAMRLIGNPANPRLVTLKTRLDHTDRMAQWAARRLAELEREDLCGFIFKSRSPSSGLERVKVYNEKGYAVKAGVGIFARLFRQHFPYLPVEEEGRLTDPMLRETFIENIFIMKEWRDAVAGNRLSGLLKFHERMKYSFMARSPVLLGRMGRLLAGHQKGALPAVRDEYYQLLAALLKCKFSAKLNLNVLQHLIGYFKQQLNSAEKGEFGEILKHYRAGDLPLIVPATLLNHYVRKYSSAYLANQYYLNPHPLELQLRNHV